MTITFGLIPLFLYLAALAYLGHFLYTQAPKSIGRAQGVLALISILLMSHALGTAIAIFTDYGWVNHIQTIIFVFLFVRTYDRIRTIWS